MNVVEREDDIELLLQQIDPFNNQRMTYSEMVHMLSSHMVPMQRDNGQQMVPLIEKFVNAEN
jgi:hypothetical protein